MTTCVSVRPGDGAGSGVGAGSGQFLVSWLEKEILPCGSFALSRLHMAVSSRFVNCLFCTRSVGAAGTTYAEMAVSRELVRKNMDRMMIDVWRICRCVGRQSSGKQAMQVNMAVLLSSGNTLGEN